MSVTSGTHKLNFSKFPAGETMVSIEPITYISDYLHLHLSFESNSDLIDLALTVDAARRRFDDLQICLFIAYMPYARQDRVCNQGESLSIKVIADFINSLKFNRVIAYDLHSDVSVALFDNLLHYDLVECIMDRELDTIILEQKLILVAPDAGAVKKVSKLNQHLENGYMVTASKTRDVATGKISGTKTDIEQHLGDRDLLIVDDILDNGGTFIPLAQELRKHTNGKIYLYVTHGLFNSGVDKFKGIIDGFYVFNNMMKPEFKDSCGLILKP